MPNKAQLDHRKQFIEENAMDKADLSEFVFVLEINGKDLSSVEKALDEFKHMVPFFCLVGMGSRYKEKDYGFRMNITTDPLHKHKFD